MCRVLSDYLDCNIDFFFFSLTYLKTVFHIPDFDTVAPWLGKKVICNFEIDFSVIFALLCLFNTCHRWSEAVCVCSGSCWRKELQNVSAASSRHLWAADLSDIYSRMFDFLQECCETPLDFLCLQEINAALLICREARFTLAGHISCVCVCSEVCMQGLTYVNKSKYDFGCVWYECSQLCLTAVLDWAHLRGATKID